MIQISTHFIESSQFRGLKQGFFYTFEKTQGEKNLNFSAFGRKLKPYFFKNPKLLEILSTWQFFSKNLNIFLAVKSIFCVCLTQSLTKTARSAQKKSIFPPIFAWKNWFSQETQAIWKKLKQLLGKTQENIQKLKQNEHQVLSCSQKKCKIKTPALKILHDRNHTKDTRGCTETRNFLKRVKKSKSMLKGLPRPCTGYTEP